jgi:hypothetical protein
MSNNRIEYTNYEIAMNLGVAPLNILLSVIILADQCRRRKETM